MRILAIILCLVGGLLSAATAKQPNIVFIFSDDHAYQAISAYGDARKLIQTPNIDRIANEGMRFDRALVTNSICGPSRAVILTGKYSHLNGFYNNSNSVFNGEQLTFPKLLQKSGYQTAVIGKWHLVSDPVGFDFWQVLPGQGLYYNPPMKNAGGMVKTEGYVTDIVTDLSLDWVRKRDKSKPFMLMCQHKAPHREWAPNIKDLGFDKDRVYPEPATLFDDYADRAKAVAENDMTLEKTIVPLDVKLVRPPNLDAEQAAVWDAFYEPRNEAFRKANPQGKDLVRWRYQRYMHDYLATVKAVDDNVGRVLHCRANHIPLVTIGSAGGQVDPTRIAVCDLSRTEQEPLLARVRKRLRRLHGFPRGTKNKFGIDAVYSTEPVRHPELCATDDETNSETNEGLNGLNCAGYGSAVVVTASFGFVAAGLVLRKLAEQSD